MPSPGIEILFVGDIHLGKSPSRLPDDLDKAEHSPAAAWRNTVDRAIEDEVDAVVLAGDVVESVKDRFEALPELEAGVRRLADARIRTLGVAGNHDVEALPSLARLIPEFHLLGAGGQWEVQTLHGKDGGEVDLCGWSFNKQEVPNSPLESFDKKPRDGVPMLGVVHGDLDRPGSRHAPIARTELENAALDGWFLGHIHKPDALQVPRPIGYLGSISGVDFGPGERGLHGPWKVRVEGEHISLLEQIPLAPLRYERLDVPIDDLEVDGERTTEEVAVAAILAAARARAEELRSEGNDALRALALRVHLTGREPRSGFLAAIPLTNGDDLLRTHVGDLRIFCERIVNDARLAIDLEATARGTDPMGLLARRILALESDDEAGRALVDSARSSIEEASDSNAPVVDEGPEIREVLLRAAWELLDALRAQRPQRGAA